MTVSLLAVIVDCEDPRAQAAFWAAALSYEVTERNPGEYRVFNREEAGPSLYFMKVDEPKTVKNRLHLDLVAKGSMEAEVGRLVKAGASVVEVLEDPKSLKNPDRWTVLQDPEGNEFCVISAVKLTGWI